MKGAASSGLSMYISLFRSVCQSHVRGAPKTLCSPGPVLAPLVQLRGARQYDGRQYGNVLINSDTCAQFRYVRINKALISEYENQLPACVCGGKVKGI